jgi:hypothetical protein
MFMTKLLVRIDPNRPFRAEKPASTVEDKYPLFSVIGAQFRFLHLFFAERAKK